MRTWMLVLTISGGLWAILRRAQGQLARSMPALTYDDFYDTTVTG